MNTDTDHQRDDLTIVRLREVERMTGLRRSSIYQRAAERSFQRPLKLGERASGWLRREIVAWVEERIAERDSAAA